MAITFQLTDGVTTIDFVSSPFYLLTYTPGTPEVDVSSTPRISGGADVHQIRYQNVSEEWSCDIEGITESDRQATQGEINRMFQRAHRYAEKKIGARVFVQFRPDGSETLVRSQIFWGRAEITEQFLDYEAAVGTYQLNVVWERSAFWEFPEVQLPLTNAHGINDTSGLTVYNHADVDVVAGDEWDNHVEINAADVDGDMPAPCRIEMTNTYNNSNRAQEFFIAHNTQSAPAVFDHIIQGESTSTSYGATTEVDGTASNDNVARSTALTSSAETKFEWDLSTALLNAAGGNWFRVLMRLTETLTNNYWIRFQIKFSLTVIDETDWVLLEGGAFESELKELSAIQLPPYLVGSGDLYPLTINLQARQDTGGEDLVVDFLQLSPLDGWRKLTPRGYGLAYSARLVDDMIDNFVWTDGWGTPGKTGHYIGEGEPILLWPNETQRLYFLHRGQSGSADIDRTLSVKVYYRPRRISI